MKAPDLDEEDPKDPGSGWSEAALEFAFRRAELRDFIVQDPVMRILDLKQIGHLQGPIAAPATADSKLVAAKNLMHLLKETGLMAGQFDPNDLFDLDLDQIQASTHGLFDKLRVLVGEVPATSLPMVPDPGSASTKADSTSCRTSSPFVSAAEAGSDTSSEPRRMSLGPSGASMLQARSKAQRPDHPRSGSRKQAAKQADQATTATGSGSDESTGRLESYFQAAMSRFLREQQTPAPQAIQNPGSQDVDMESTESPDPDHSHWEYDPDELDFPTPSRAAVATTTAGSTGSTMIQRVRISAISDLKEFSGKDQDEDRARAWVGKVKSAFLRDQASDGEKCLTFADLLSGSARNWYRQLPRSTRNKWSELLRSFQIQYCGFGISVARQYYHARKRSDESALEYLHRLNVAGLRARLKIKDGGPKEKREHVDHFIETLGDQDLADRLTLLRLPDADELEEVLRALDRAKNRMKKSAFGSSKYRQKASATPAPAVPAKHVRAVQIQAPDSGSDSSSDGFDSDGDDYRRIYMAGGGEPPPQAEEVPHTLDRGQLERRSADQVPRDHRSRVHADGSDRSRCSHCGSRKHTELGCWRRLTCQKCGKRGHPADHCLFVCRGCGELHDMGKCPMEEFYNWIRQWYNPTKHAGMLPEKAEKMLN
ncbi:Eukaryotic/viral aspartic protease, active site [Phytophthora cinnamomi]|uniref:Eukaryotic/viral aspartic protease, active site n=1 Tax=Phytophthora cinnamomi TaxID=4785 RepID=UPI003559D664|nr:Eukaryotic/viral aspartic protease, active site [Phytophthora cinnamomi]